MLPLYIINFYAILKANLIIQRRVTWLKKKKKLPAQLQQPKGKNVKIPYKGNLNTAQPTGKNSTLQDNSYLKT